VDIYTVLRERDTGDRVIGQRARISMAQCIIGQPALAPSLLSVCNLARGPVPELKGMGACAGCADNQIGDAGAGSIAGGLASGKSAVTHLRLNSARLAPLCLPTRSLPASLLPRLGAAAAVHWCGVGRVCSQRSMAC